MNLKKDKEQKRNSKDRLLASQMENQDFISVGEIRRGIGQTLSFLSLMPEDR